MIMQIPYQKKCYVGILIMVIMIDMTGWLKLYYLYIGKPYVSAVVLANFRQSYMNAMIIYVLCT